MFNHSDETPTSKQKTGRQYKLNQPEAQPGYVPQNEPHINKCNRGRTEERKGKREGGVEGGRKIEGKCPPTCRDGEKVATF